jgi:hypothetical protein
LAPGYQASEEASAVIPFATPARRARRRGDGSVFIAVLLVAVAAVVLVATMPAEASPVSRVLASRRVQAVLERIPQPWKAPRPDFVAAPEGPLPAAAEAPAPASASQSVASRAAVGSAAPLVGSAVGASSGGSAQVDPPPAAGDAPGAAFGPGAEALPPPPARALLQGFRHQYQTWNNCGPATITMATSHFGRTETQAQAAPFLKPNQNDKNVSPDELVAYVRSVGLQADWRVAGTAERLKQLIANGVPVVVETWFIPHPNDEMGHYRLLMGYDDAAARFFAYDSYMPPGANVPIPYDRFDVDWRVFNRTYVPVYPSEKADLVARILGPDRDDAAMWERSLAVARAEAAAVPNDPFAWFNAGTSLVALGATRDAVPAFDRARTLRLPWRMLWYQFAIFEAYLAEGRPGDVVSLTAANLQQANDLEESHYFRGRALEAQGQPAGARSAYQAAIRSNPKYAPANHALAVLG